jgi:hypothetical protein
MTDDLHYRVLKHLTARFLQRKRAEYEALKAEIAPLDAEVRADPERLQP